MTLKLIGLVVLGGALLCAQPRQGGRGPGGEDRAFADLGLTAEQQNAIHTAREDAKVQSKGIADQVRTLRTQLNDAVKANNVGAIDSLARQIADQEGQMMAIDAKAEAKIYSVLTADQKAKVDQRRGFLRGAGPGARGNARPGRAPQ